MKFKTDRIRKKKKKVKTCIYYLCSVLTKQHPIKKKGYKKITNPKNHHLQYQLKVTIPLDQHTLKI